MINIFALITLLSIAILFILMCIGEHKREKRKTISNIFQQKMDSLAEKNTIHFNNAMSILNKEMRQTEAYNHEIAQWEKGVEEWKAMLSEKRLINSKNN
jgi:hypothetical protein